MIDPWNGRRAGMKCRSCIWFVPKTPLTEPSFEEVDAEQTTAVKPVLGRCRRHAPSMGGYPVVWEHDWCGDHRLDEEKV